MLFPRKHLIGTIIECSLAYTPTSPEFVTYSSAITILNKVLRTKYTNFEIYLIQFTWLSF